MPYVRWLLQQCWHWLTRPVFRCVTWLAGYPGPWFCPACGTEGDEEAAQCHACGRRLAPPEGETP